MLKFNFLFLFLISFCSIGIAQQDNLPLDSLQYLIESTKEPLRKAKLYDKLASKFIYKDTDKALEYATKGFALVAKKDTSTVADFHNLIGVILGEFGNEKQIKEGLLHLDTALVLYTQLDDQLGRLKILSNQGGLYRSLYKHDLALKSFHKGVLLAKELGDTSGITQNLSGIAGVYLAKKEVDKSLEYIKKAYTIEQKYTKNKADLVAYTYNIGHIYYMTEVFDSSLYYLNLSLNYLGNNKNSSIEGVIYERISSVYQKQEKLDTAIWYINKSLKLAEDLNNESLKVKASTTLAKIFFQKGNWEKSIFYAQKNLASAKESGNYMQQAINLEVLTESYVALKDFKMAYSYQSKLVEVEELLMDKKQREHIDELELQYESYKKEQENKLLASERDVQKYKAERNEQFSYAMFLALILVVLIAYGVYKRTKLVAKERTTKLKHQLLRNQMNPHFIFNALIAIQSFVYKNEPKETDKYLSAFSKLMRGILENSTHEYISLEKELKWLKSYFQLQALRFDHEFDYEIVVDPNVDIYNTLIPPMLTQPFIENALEHGLKNIDYKGKIDLSFEEENSALKITIRDNGVGIKLGNAVKKKDEHNSLATVITKERLQFLNKKATSRIYFEINPLQPKGTLVSFKIPLKYT
ncbi:tetratricopeptide repeat-containing sensor histidine kinase [Aureispira anguillae]|uniref:Histidine kinase n=1 Tax=Aureispira anguillae TaxID=2864201 RepID=A0A915YJP6_9BACT|nr:histidine kinase [Aureispira anguillae]BDS14462.1 histidine kinase [Aureispira anguillae]